MLEQDLFGDMPPASSHPKHIRGRPSRSLHSWFFAVRPSAEEASCIYAFADELLASRGISGSRIAPERLHITLELIGHDLNEAGVDAACRAADSIRWFAIQARFDSAGSFAAPSGPFVLLGGEGLDDVRALRTSLECALAEQGFAPSPAYEPHMTLCYDRRHRAPRTPIAPVGFRIDNFSLIKSHIGFSRHEVMRTWRLDTK